MRIFFRDKNEEVNFNKNGIPNVSIDSDIYVVSNFLFFKSNNELQVFNDKKPVYQTDCHAQVNSVFYNNDLRMVAIVNSKSKLELLLKIDYDKTIINIGFTELILGQVISPYNFYYKFSDKLELLYKDSNYMFEAFTSSVLEKKDNKKVELEESKKHRSDDNFLFKLQTNFDYQITCKNQESVIYLLDKKDKIVSGYPNHSCEIKNYAINLKQNLLATISVQNRICVWKILRKGLQLWITQQTSPALIHEDIAFSEDGDFIGIITEKYKDNHISTLNVYKIIKKNNTLMQFKTIETKSYKIKNSDFNFEIIDKKPKIIKTTNEKENKIPVINKQEAKQKHEQEIRQELEQEIRQKLEQEIRQELEQEAKQKLEQEAKQKLEQEVKQKLEQETKQKLEQEAKQKLEQETKQKLEQEAKQKLEQEAKQKLEEGNKKELEEEIKQKYRVEVKQKLKEKVKEPLENDSKCKNPFSKIPNSRFESFPQISISENTIFNNHYKLPEQRAEVDSVEVYIGIDIGTKYSKVMVEIEGSTMRYLFPLENKKRELFFPTEVYIADNKIYFNEDEVKTRLTNYEKVDYLKLRFEYDQNVRALFIVYIMHMINKAKVFVHNWRKTTEFRFHNLDYYIAFSYPETLIVDSNKSNFKNFKNVLATAESLLKNASQNKFTLAQINEEFSKTEYCDNINEIAVKPESISEIFSFIEVIDYYGQIVLIDIGEGTTELSGCWIDHTKGKKISVWGSKVLFKGVFDYNNGKKEEYKNVLRAELQKLLENKKAFYEGEGFSNPNTVFVGGGGCMIKDIISCLSNIVVNNRDVSLKIENLSDYKSFNTKRLLPENILMNYHRFLVSMGSIESLKREDSYDIINYSENKEKERINPVKKRPQTRKEKDEENKRLYEL